MSREELLNSILQRNIHKVAKDFTGYLGVSYNGDYTVCRQINGITEILDDSEGEHFSWGHSGEGSKSLAKSILSEVFGAWIGEDLEVVANFAKDRVSKFQKNWSIPTYEVKNWYSAYIGSSVRFYNESTLSVDELDITQEAKRKLKSLGFTTASELIKYGNEGLSKFIILSHYEVRSIVKALGLTSTK